MKKVAARQEKQGPRVTPSGATRGRQNRAAASPSRSTLDGRRRRHLSARDGGGRGGAEAGDHPPPILSTSPHSFSPQTPDTNSHGIRRGCSIRVL